MVRCHHLADLSYDFDEAYSWKMTTFPASEIASRIASDLPPPLYFYSLWAWSRVFGDSPQALRSLSVLFGLATVVGAYLLVAKGCGSVPHFGSSFRRPEGEVELPALAAAALVALSPFQVDFSQRARMYSLGAALTLISCWLLLRALATPRRRWRDFVWYALAGAALAYTHSAGLLVLAAQFAYTVGRLVVRCAGPHPGGNCLHSDLLPAGEGDGCHSSAIPRHSSLIYVAFTFVLTGLLWLPWAPSFFRQCQQASRQYPANPFSWHEVAKACYQTFAVRWEDEPPRAVIAWSAAAACLLLPAAMLLWRRGGLRLIGLCVLATFDGALCFSIGGQNVMQSRYFVFANALLLSGLPPLLLAPRFDQTNLNLQLGTIADSPRRRFASMFAGAGMAALVAGMAWICLAHAQRREDYARRPGMMGAMAYLAETRHAGEPIVVCNPMLQVTAAAHTAGNTSTVGGRTQPSGRPHSGPSPKGIGEMMAVQVLSSNPSWFPYFQGTAVMREEEYLSPQDLGTSTAQRVWTIDAVDWILPEWKLLLPPQWIEVSSATFREWPAETCRIIVRCYQKKTIDER
jgi:hypothetical protein